MSKFKLFFLFLLVAIGTSISQAQFNFWHGMNLPCPVGKHRDTLGCSLNTQTCSVSGASSCSKVWQKNTRKYLYTVPITFLATNSGTGYMSVKAGATVIVNITGSNTLGGSGGYNAGNNSSAYGNSSQWSYVSGCPLGAVIYYFGGQGWRCIAPGATITNDSGADNILVMRTNDSDIGNNSGSLAVVLTYQAYP